MNHPARCECFECDEARHRAAHPTLVHGCMACKLDTIQVSQRVKAKKASAAPAGNANSWERGTVKDHRGVPLLDGSGEPIGVKRYAENRHVFEEDRRTLASHPDPFRVKAT